MVALLPACREKVPEGRMRGCEKYGLGARLDLFRLCGPGHQADPDRYRSHAGGQPALTCRRVASCRI